MGDFCHKLYKILRTALSDRVTLIYLSFPETEGWELRAKTHTPIILSYLVVGLLINPNHVSRLVDHGPSAEDKKAAFTFRQFWGEKAELRRFKDGSILESLIWSEEESKSSILQQITSYSLHRHFGKDVANTLSFIGDSFDHLLPDNDNNSAQSLEQFRHLITAFAHLEQDIRALDGLPLEIRRLSAVSPESRYSSFRAPFSAGNGDGSNPMDVTAQFESSARWPDDFIAVQRTKIAFLLKIGELLEEAVNGVMTRLGLENESHTFLNASFLDITYTTGITFRLRVHHDREQTLLERQLRKVSLDPRHRHLTSMALSTYKRDFLQLPLHADSMRTLCTSFPFLSPTVRLMKKWCNGHLLTTHVSEELLEILVVRTFVQPYPWRAPASVMAGFLRTLRFISAWDWRNEPLILTFSGALDPKEKDAIELRFQAWRKLDPAMNRVVMFAASNLDPSGVSWTENGPSKVVAERLVSLATAVCTLVKQQGLGIDPATLFTSSLMDYDFVIHLSTNVTRKARTGQKRTAQFKNLQSQSSASAHLTGYNPAELFLDELKIIYGNAIVFFYDGTDGDIIAGLWNPQTGSRQWKVNLAYSTAPLVEERGGDEARIGLNKDAILNDIARLGGDLMERIVANR